ncbi:MAG: hypothetical protein WCY25_05935 [Moheibacter sp.]
MLSGTFSPTRPNTFNMKNNLLKFGLIAFFWVAYSLPLLAGPEDPDPGDDPPWEDPAPIDNGILVLILAAAAVGIYFLAKYRRKSAA